MLTLDPIQTLACGGLCLITGYAIRRHVPLLARFNIPAPVIGGLLVALAVLACRYWDFTPVQFDTALKQPLMIAFFTSIGFNASVALLKVGGRQVALLLGLATVALIVQNVVGMGIAGAFGLHPLFGVLAGSTTLAGGPATGLAFAPLFEQAGVRGAESIALATAMAGIVCGSILGAPLATLLMERFHLQPRPSAAVVDVAIEIVQEEEGGSADGEGDRIHAGLKGFVLIVVAMGIGTWVSVGLDALDVTLPSYIGAMLVGAVIRNLDDTTGWIGLPLVRMDVIGGICLSLFLAVALMDLHLWELAGLAAPLLVNLIVQALLVALFCLWPLLWMMGRDYDAAVMAGGFTGFMLGTTANAMAVMGSMTERYGPAPRAFLVAPLVGAFFIDFVNAVVITIFVNWWT
jgi:ESS family glutamate:Na+ symporter